MGLINNDNNFIYNGLGKMGEFFQKLKINQFW